MCQTRKPDIRDTREYKVHLLRKRFSYLSEKELEALINGKKFIEVPEAERARLRVDSYGYWM